MPKKRRYEVVYGNEYGGSTAIGIMAKSPKAAIAKVKKTDKKWIKGHKVEIIPMRKTLARLGRESKKKKLMGY